MQVLSKEEALQFVREHRSRFDSAGQRNPFACSAWILHSIDQVAAADWKFVFPESLAAGKNLLLLYAQPEEPTHLKALANIYTSLYSPLLDSAAGGPDTIAGLVRQLGELRPRPDIVTLAPMDRSATETAALRQEFSKNGWYAKQYFCFGNWYLPCAGYSFSGYMQERPSQLYNTWLRKTKKLKEQGLELEIVTRPGEVETAMEAYGAVYARSWKQAERYPGFIPGWARICAEHGWLRLGLARLGSTPIAAQFWFVMHGRAYIFKLAYDEQYARWSAGTILTAHMIQHVLERDKVAEIDFLSGDDAYKSAWMTARRERVGIRACNLRTGRGLLTALAELAGTMRKRWQCPAARNSGDTVL